MLTVKIINQDGLENIAETVKAQYSPQYNYIGLDEGGMDIPAGAIAYIMNSSGKTISRHCGPDVVQMNVQDESGDNRVGMVSLDEPVIERHVSKAEFQKLLLDNPSPSGWNFINPNARSLKLGNTRYIEC